MKHSELRKIIREELSKGGKGEQYFKEISSKLNVAQKLLPRGEFYELIYRLRSYVNKIEI